MNIIRVGSIQPDTESIVCPALIQAKFRHIFRHIQNKNRTKKTEELKNNFQSNPHLPVNLVTFEQLIFWLVNILVNCKYIYKIPSYYIDIFYRLVDAIPVNWLIPGAKYFATDSRAVGICALTRIEITNQNGSFPLHNFLLCNHMHSEK